jgi:hypothetical protein
MSALKETKDNQNPLPGDVDGLLHDFFKSETPQSWPALNLSSRSRAPAIRPVPRNGLLSRSRTVLAASVLLLLTGPLFLSDRFSGYRPLNADSQTGQTEATGRKGQEPKYRSPKGGTRLDRTREKI